MEQTQDVGPINFDINDVKSLAKGNASSTSISDTLVGMNHRMLPPSLPKHQDRMGLVYFTRPMLRLDPQNLVRDRRLAEFMAKVPESIQRWARCTLDPRQMTEYIYGNADGASKITKKAISCPLVNNELPFIPILSNQLLKLNGWPDPVIDTYKSPEGIYKEVFIGVDGLYDIYRNFTLNATFKNSKLNPIYKLMNLWTLYMSKVKTGELLPYEDFALFNMLDYTTRVYVLVLDETGDIVVGSAMTGYSMPITSAIGSRYDVDTTQVFNNNTDEINIAFECSGAYYDDPYTLKCFNDLVEITCPAMQDKYRETYMVRIPRMSLEHFSFMGFPRINFDEGNRLETWVSRGMAKMHLEKLNNFRAAIGEPKIFVDGVNYFDKGGADLSTGDFKYTGDPITSPGSANVMDVGSDLNDIANAAGDVVASINTLNDFSDNSLA